MNNVGTLADVRCVTNLLYITHFQPTVYIDYQLLRVLSIQILLTSSIHVTKAATLTCDHLYCIPVPQSTFLRSTTILRHSTRAPGAHQHRPGRYWLDLHFTIAVWRGPAAVWSLSSLPSTPQFSCQCLAFRFLLLNSCIKEPHFVFCCIYPRYKNVYICERISLDRECKQGLYQPSPPRQTEERCGYSADPDLHQGKQTASFPALL